VTARLFVQRRNLVGLRPLAFALVALLGTVSVVLVPTLVTAAIVWLESVLGVPSGIGALTAIVAFLLTAFLVLHNVGRGLESAVKLRAPWGRIAIGAEGVRWDDWVRRKLTPWRDVHGTITEGQGVVLVTREGTRIVLATNEVEALRESIRAARAAHSASERAEIPEALSSERDTTRWIERVRTLLARDSYRGAGVPPAVLARVLEDPDAPASARVSAAAALLPADRAQRARVERARDESVDDELATALDDLLQERVVPARWAKLARRG